MRNIAMGGALITGASAILLGSAVIVGTWWRIVKWAAK